MTRARAPAVIVQMPQTCGSLACVERATDYTRNYYRSAEDQRKQRQQRERRRRARARRKFAFALALLIVAGLLAAFMPWSGTAPELPADIPPDTEEANSAAGLTAGQAFVAIPKQDKPATYTPPAAEVEALAKMLYGEARGMTLSRKLILDYLRGRGFGGESKNRASTLDSWDDFLRFRDWIEAKGPAASYFSNQPKERRLRQI